MSFHVDIIAVGRLKNTSPLLSVYDDYAKRLTGKLTLTEIEGHNQSDELDKLKSKISNDASLIALDEKGKTLPSIEFAKKMESFQLQKSGKIQFIIGGADGLDDEIRSKADLVLSFGKLTWPHMMARIMLIEQIYRAQQILAGHPYHRE